MAISENYAQVCVTLYWREHNPTFWHATLISCRGLSGRRRDGLCWENNQNNYYPPGLDSFNLASTVAGLLSVLCCAFELMKSTKAERWALRPPPAAIVASERCIEYKKGDFKLDFVAFYLPGIFISLHFQYVRVRWHYFTITFMNRCMSTSAQGLYEIMVDVWNGKRRLSLSVCFVSTESPSAWCSQGICASSTLVGCRWQAWTMNCLMLLGQSPRTGIECPEIKPKKSASISQE